MTDPILAQPHFVYVLQVPTGEVKIGVAQDVQSRIAKLQTGNHQKIELVYKLEVADRETALFLEGLLHQRFADTTVHGEWFSVNADRLMDDIRFAVAFSEAVRSISGTGAPHPVGDAFLRLSFEKQVEQAARWASNRASISGSNLRWEFEIPSTQATELLRALWRDGRVVQVEDAKGEFRYVAPT